MIVVDFIEPSGFLNIGAMPACSLQDLFRPCQTTDHNFQLTNRELENTPENQEKIISSASKSFKIIKKGTQESNAGPIDESLAKDYCDGLNEHLRQSHAIVFSADRLQNPVSGGTCSAMSFEFANDYLRRRPSSPPQMIFDDLEKKYETSSEYFRTIQSTFNTLHRNKEIDAEDFLKEKVASMMHFYDRTVTDSSETFNIEFDPKNEAVKATEIIESFLDQHPQGVFVIRCILLEPNEKGEAYGHSMILINDPEGSYFYDPGQGVFELSQDDPAGSLMEVLKPVMLKWAVPLGRLYKIE